MGSTFDANGQEQVLTTVDLNNSSPSGQVFISIIGFNNRFTPAFEASGRIIFEASDGELLEVTIGDADISEPYSWVPSNSLEVVAFVLHIKSLADQDATLTLRSDTEVPQSTVEIGSVDFPLTLSWSVSSIMVVTIPSVEIDSVSFPITLSWSVDSVEVEEYNIGSIAFPLTLSWSVASIEVVTIPSVEIGAVDFPVTLSWSVSDIEVVTIPSVEIGSVDFPLTLAFSITDIEVDQPAVDVEIGAVSFPVTLSWNVGSIEVRNPGETGSSVTITLPDSAISVDSVSFRESLSYPDAAPDISLGDGLSASGNVIYLDSLLIPGSQATQGNFVLSLTGASGVSQSGIEFSDAFESQGLISFVASDGMSYALDFSIIIALDMTEPYVTNRSNTPDGLKVFISHVIGLSDHTLIVTFNDQQDPPEVDIITLPRTVYGGSTVFLEAAVSDPDHDLADLTLEWTSSGGGSFDDDTESLTTWISPVVSANQIITLTLTAEDPFDNTGFDTVDITVRPPPTVIPDPIIAPTGPVVITPERTTITEGEDIQLIGSVMLQDDRAPQEFRVNESLNRLELLVESSLALRIQAFRRHHLGYLRPAWCVDRPLRVGRLQIRDGILQLEAQGESG